MKKIILYGIVFLALMGITFTSFLVHETIHLIRLDKPEDICVSIGGGDYFMYVTGEDTHWKSKTEEVLAYSGQFSFVILLASFVWLYFKEERLKR